MLGVREPQTYGSRTLADIDARIASEASALGFTVRCMQCNSEGGIVDVYRQLEPATTDDCYTWWSNRGQAYANNVGWRLDYHLATPTLAQGAKVASIYKGEKFSDHAPITIDYHW